MRKLFHRMLGGAALLAASLTGGTWIYTQHPKFGKLPDGASRLHEFKGGKIVQHLAHGGLDDRA